MLRTDAGQEKRNCCTKPPGSSEMFCSVSSSSHELGSTNFASAMEETQFVCVSVPNYILRVVFSFIGISSCHSNLFVHIINYAKQQSVNRLSFYEFYSTFRVLDAVFIQSLVPRFWRALDDRSLVHVFALN